MFPTVPNPPSKPCKATIPRAGTTILARRAASARYREKNQEQLQSKARECMARLRAKPPASPATTSHGRAQAEAQEEERRQKARERSRAYRERHAAQIAIRKRTARDVRFIQLHGFEAFAERQAIRNARKHQVEDDAQLRELDQAYREDLSRRRAHRDAAESLHHLHAHVP
ncbi:hypothetical protein C8F01DRAFT_1304254 [Mycena amicta]|nr:hypothetical protein C8F01DRAFT_1304254 [Mycena amicta]